MEENDERMEDLGFRVFKLRGSHYRNWFGVEDKQTDQLEERMELFTDPLVSGWEPQDVIWEIAIKEGYSLSSAIEEVDVDSPNQVYRVSDRDKGQSLLVCLDDEPDEQLAERLGLSEEDVFVCVRSAHGLHLLVKT